MTTITREEDRYGRMSFIGYDRGFYEFPTHRIVFITITSTGNKREGERFSGYYISRELAEDAFDMIMRDWLKDKPGNLHWRYLPEARREVFYSLTSGFNSPDRTPVLTPIELWVVYSRVAVDPYIPYYPD